LPQWSLSAIRRPFYSARLTRFGMPRDVWIRPVLTFVAAGVPLWM
jgi:hypothetical protein